MTCSVLLPGERALRPVALGQVARPAQQLIVGWVSGLNNLLVDVARRPAINTVVRVAGHVIDRQQFCVDNVASWASAPALISFDDEQPEPDALSVGLGVDRFAVVLDVPSVRDAAHSQIRLWVAFAVCLFGGFFVLGVSEPPGTGLVAVGLLALFVDHTLIVRAGNDPYRVCEYAEDIDRRTSFRGEVNPA